MRIIAKGIQTGKTTELIKRSAETGFPIVCRHRLAANRILDLAKNLGLSIPAPYTYAELTAAAVLINPGRPVLIDDAEELLKCFCPVPIDTISILVQSIDAGEPQREAIQ